MTTPTIIELLQTYTFEQKVDLAHRIGLTIACCPGCGCYAGKPDCPDTYSRYHGFDECICPDNPDNDEEGEDG